MPDLDLTDVLTDPDFADTFVVRRLVEAVGANGRAAKRTFDSQAVGVVTPGSDNSLAIGADEGHAGKTLTVITTFRIQGPAPGFLPDLIYWGGDFFKVTKVEDYSRYGAGFVQAEASSIDSVDQPPCGF